MGSSKFSDEELIQRAFLRATRVMFGMWEERGSSDTRLLDPPLIPDQYVRVGESLDGAEHREHVVPRKVICDECHKMFKEGTEKGIEVDALIKLVADLIRKHLKIIHISMKEKECLDQGKQLNLRQSMPKGWSFESGDTYARLHEANIKFRLNGE